MAGNYSPKAWGFLILLSLIWGSSFILIKKGLLGLSAMEVGSIRILSASLFMMPLAFRHLRRVNKLNFKYLLSVGFLGSLIPSFLFAIAQTRIQSSLTGVLNALTPLFTILVGILVFSKYQPSKVFVGVAFGLLGSSVLILSGANSLTLSINFYAFFIVLATVMYAFNLNIIKYKLQDLGSVAITSVSLVMVGPLAAIQLFGFTDFSSKMFAAEALQPIFYILILGVVGTAMALIIFNKLVSLTDPLFTSSVTYIIPIVAVVWGLIDGETIGVIQALAIGAILVGVYIANRSSRVPNTTGTIPASEK